MLRGQKIPKPTKFNNLLDVVKLFPDEKACREHLEKVRWDGKIICQKCGSDEKIYKINDGKLYKCSKCRKQFTVRVGTIFEDSPLPLLKWFMAIYLLTAHKKGISSVQLGKDIEVTQDTAWYMLHRIRYAVRNGTFDKPMDGIVECDETYYGGLEKNKHSDKKVKRAQGRNSDSKTPIFGIMQRGGNVYAIPVNNVSGASLQPIISERVSKDATVITDEWRSYNGLNKTFSHLRVDHGKVSMFQDLHILTTLNAFGRTLNVA